MSRGEKVTFISFVVAVIGWTLPSLMSLFDLPYHEEISQALPSGAVAIFASLILFAFADEQNEPVLSWRDAATIDWGLIFLFGGGLALGAQMIETGLADSMGQFFVNATGVQSNVGLCIALTLFTIYFTEICSNTAAANMLVPLAISGAAQLGISPTAAVLCVAFASSCAFMLPIATGPNAVAYGTGRVSFHSMVRTGFWLNPLAAAALLLTVGLSLKLLAL
ncbi:MAG: SLC13 family permease [Polyangiales bacterium]